MLRRNCQTIGKACGSLVAIVLLAACHSHTTIQRDYNSVRDLCQLDAEARIKRFASNGDADEKTRNAKLVTLFSNCMFDDGWSVATPSTERQPSPQFRADPGVGAGASIRPGRQPAQPANTTQNVYNNSYHTTQQQQQLYPVQRAQPYPQQGYGVSPNQTAAQGRQVPVYQYGGY